MNLLPHLRWLTEIDYPHVYYMDAEPMVFDANIFPDDSDHPGGWGTVLVMGMRLGGGDIKVTVDGVSRTMRSAWVVLDITNPEKPPQLLAEITHPGLGFTTSRPALIKHRQAGLNATGEVDWDNPRQNQWYLVFGSGPAGSDATARRSALDQGASDQNLQVFIYDLANRGFVSGFDPLTTSFSGAYAGDMVAEDWDHDYQDDAVYFGSVETGGEQLAGKLLRLEIAATPGNAAVDVLLDTGQPIMAAPLTLSDNDSHWIYAGTGRLLTNSDNRDTTAHYFYGVQEPLSSSSNLTYAQVSLNSLVDVGDVEVFADGSVRRQTASGYEPFMIDSQTINDFTILQDVIAERGGWKLPLDYNGTDPAGRSINPASQLFSQILFSSYTPPLDSCSIDGTSDLYAVHYQTGTAAPDGVLDRVYVNNLNVERSLKSVSLGVGYASSPVVHQGSSGKLSAVTQGAGGSIDSINIDYRFSTRGRQSWWQIFRIPWIE